MRFDIQLKWKMALNFNQPRTKVRGRSVEKEPEYEVEF